MRKRTVYIPGLLIILGALLPAFTDNLVYAQSPAGPASGQVNNLTAQPGCEAAFIQNIGQYGKAIKGYERMGSLLYGYEGFGMPVLFTPKGLVYLQRKIEKIPHAEEERLEKTGLKEEEIERKRKVTDQLITMEWLNTDPSVKIIAEEKITAYYTYGLLKEKAYGYKKLVYKNAYPGIDIVYSFSNNAAAGFEYSLVVHPGANLNEVKLKYGGDIKSVRSDAKGNLVVRSGINGISSTVPVSYYGQKPEAGVSSDIPSVYKVEGYEVGFSFPKGYDASRTFVIDPFVTATTNLNGVNSGKAKDVDFDYEGNIYVTGGGDGSQYKLAKYNAAGILQWTFNGATVIPSWTFGPYYGGWVVEKNTGNIYLGQGFNPGTGYQVIRISTTGLYDNYISAGNTSFNENWKMYWSCNNGTPQILVVGGGTSSNLNLGILSPPSTTITPLNLTGIAGVCQDMVDMVLDPATNDMYTLFASLFVTPVINNKIYKNTAPYSAATIAWNVASGYSVVQEAGNRPYMAPNLATYDDNSANMLSVNASYLFYWDGKNLKAFDKSTGAVAGTPLTTANTAKMQGGIIADACNNIFVGEGNGLIKVYSFNGSVFSDAPADISIPGFPGKAVYDLAYDESRKLIYASGDGFVGSFDVSSYCPATTYTVSVTPNCIAASATATVSPAPPLGSTVTYTLYTGATQVASNTTGIFTGLAPNTTYSIIATINLACSGTQATGTFTVPGPAIGIVLTHTVCGANSGSITASGSGTAGPYTYNINGGAFQPGGSFTGLAAGVYTIVVKDAGGCPNDTVVTILNSDGPVLTFNQTNADCGSNNGTVTANVTGGIAPYQYSINGGVTWQSGNFFTGLTGGQYTLVVKDANACTNAAVLTITSSPSPLLTAIPASATCGSSNGTITAFGSGGTAPLQYSINGNTFQVSNVFTNLTPGAYTVTVKDANGCTKAVNVIIDNSPAPTLTAAQTAAACNNVNGTITATGNGGIAPLQYSINGTVFQQSNIFTGLAAGLYTVTVKDATGCTNITTITVLSTGAPLVSASSTVSSCSTNTGTITITGSGGAPGYQYSINGSTFQVSNLFSGLAAGNYTAYVRDANNCIGALPVVVGNIAGPVIAVTVTPASCSVNDGVITATGSSGSTPYTYSLDGITYGVNNVFNGLAAGVYTVYVKDANGCIKSAAATVSNVSGLTLAVSTIVSSCSTNNGTITAVASGGIAPLQYSIDGITYQAGNVFNGLAAGVYTVYVKDANNCIVSRPAIIGTVSGPSLAVTILQQATCGTSSGVIRATGSGGLAPLTYNIDGGTFQPVGIFINVAPGVHTIIVKDATGCSSAPQAVTITNSGSGTAPTDVTFTVNGVLACTGEGRIKNLKGVPSGGGNNYTFSLDGGAFTTANQFRPVSIGTHVITAKNQNGCTVSKLATIGLGVPATATATSTATACNTSNGTITITGVGANTPYHSSIDNGVTWVTFFPPGVNSFTFTGLAPGTYPVIIADDADFTTGPPDIPGACLTTIFVAVPSTGGPTISTTQVNGTCSSPNGSITATGGAGTPPYTYNIDNGPYFASGVFNNLAPGLHAVTVKDATGCVTGTNVTLANPAGPGVTAITSPASCGLNNGTITATGTGGTAPLQYSINGTIFQGSTVFSNLSAGTYTLYVKDANECYGTLPVTIPAIQLPKATAFSIPASCNNNDGSIVASGTLGTPPYVFSIDGVVYQSSGTFGSLPAGFYTIYIKDARDCITTTGISVANIGAPSFNQVVIPATCGTATGVITITAAGGTAPYEYSSDGGLTYQTGNSLTGLLSSNYIVVVKDANGCLATKTIFVPNSNGPQTLTASVINAACGFSNGTITVAATGGTAPLQYSINGTTYQPGVVFNNVPAGAYTLYVKDANGCIKTLAVTVSNLAGPIAGATSSPASCGLSDGTITVTAAGGTLPLTYSNNGGLTYQPGNIFTGLAAGSYVVVAKDSRGCTDTIMIDVAAINFAGNLAGLTGGAQVCGSAVVSPGGTLYVDALCNLIAKVTPSGASPVGGMINSCVIIDGSVQLFNAEPYVQRHLDIEPATNPNNATATITLYFKDQEFVDFNTNRVGFPPLPTVAGGGNSDPAKANLKVTQYHGVPIFPHNSGNPAAGYYSVNGGSGVLIIPTSVNYNSVYSYWEVTFPVTGFSGFYVHTNIHFPLPIALEYFRGVKQQAKNILSWKVNCNDNPAVTFILERSADNSNFAGIYTTVTDVIKCRQPFNYTDSLPLPGKNHYRLKMITADGKTSYSNVLSFSNESKGFEITGLSPNPVTGNRFNLNITSQEALTVNITIIDMQGRILSRRPGFVSAGFNSISINAGDLVSGSYIISVRTAGDISRVFRFVKE